MGGETHILLVAGSGSCREIGVVKVENDHWTACLHGASDFLCFAPTSVCICVLLAEQGDGFRDSFLTA